MATEVIDLVALRKTVKIRFPNGVLFVVAPFRVNGVALLEQWKADPNNAALLMELLRLAVPDATDADFDTLSLDEDIPRVLAAAHGKTALMELALKNGLGGGVEEETTPPLLRSEDSSQTTHSPTSSAA